MEFKKKKRKKEKPSVHYEQENTAGRKFKMQINTKTFSAPRFGRLSTKISVLSKVI